MKASKHIETQRLGTLSNTIFGVAMTLLAYRIPTGQFLNGPPVWSTIWAAYHSQIAALLLSFVVAGMFWFGHQRRLAYSTRSVVYLNLLFLLSIIALPITTVLYGTYWDARDVIVLYCGKRSNITSTRSPNAATFGGIGARRRSAASWSRGGAWRLLGREVNGGVATHGHA